MTIVLQPDFTVSVRCEGPLATVDVRGELDLATAPRLARALEQLPRAATVVQLDLLEVWFADVASITRLARCRDRLEAQGRRVVVIGASTAVLGAVRAGPPGWILEGPGR